MCPSVDWVCHPVLVNHPARWPTTESFAEGPRELLSRAGFIKALAKGPLQKAQICGLQECYCPPAVPSGLMAGCATGICSKYSIAE